MILALRNLLAGVMQPDVDDIFLKRQVSVRPHDGYTVDTWLGIASKDHSSMRRMFHYILGDGM
jgi:hypothetical protein